MYHEAPATMAVFWACKLDVVREWGTDVETKAKLVDRHEAIQISRAYVHGMLRPLLQEIIVFLV